MDGTAVLVQQRQEVAVQTGCVQSFPCAIGLLRGLGDTRTPMIVNVVGFWCIGMPVSLWLGFGLDYGAQGLWWGLVVGLVIVAVFLIVRVRRREQHGLARIIIDEHAKALRAEPVVD